ncbi:MAG: hypothetical protein HRT99_02490 [Mycoplasmatales bacterium]|nr:hypothetical protein [Mycoplasmatales bacterium]
MHPDELMRLSMGEMIISLAREKPIKTKTAKF